MKAFFTDDQLLHDPQQYMRVGRICKPTDLPSRAHALRDALAGRGIALASPPDVGRAPLEAVHSTDYLDYLETAYAQWRELKVFGLEPGIEVLPNLSPYYNGVPGVEPKGITPDEVVFDGPQGTFLGGGGMSAGDAITQ